MKDSVQSVEASSHQQSNHHHQSQWQLRHRHRHNTSNLGRRTWSGPPCPRGNRRRQTLRRKTVRNTCSNSTNRLAAILQVAARAVPHPYCTAELAHIAPLHPCPRPARAPWIGSPVPGPPGIPPVPPVLVKRVKSKPILDGPCARARPR